MRLDLDAIAGPPVFGWLARAGGVAEAEMLRTFNCGIGMIVVAGRRQADAVMARLREAGESAGRARRDRLRMRGGARVTTSGGLKL